MKLVTYKNENVSIQFGKLKLGNENQFYTGYSQLYMVINKICLSVCITYVYFYFITFILFF